MSPQRPAKARPARARRLALLCVFYVTGYAAAMGLRAPAANAYYFYYDVRSVMLDAALYYGFDPLYALHGPRGSPGSSTIFGSRNRPMFAIPASS